MKELPKVRLTSLAWIKWIGDCPLIRSSELQNLFFESCKYGNAWLVDKLITKFKVDPSIWGNFSIYLAACDGHLEVVERILKDPNSTEADNSKAFRTASDNGHLEIVERLLQKYKSRSF